MTAPAVGKTRSFFWLPQFSLRQLMFLTGLFAFGVPAVLNATFMSANATLGLMYLLLTIAILAAVYCEGALRAFWLGFAVFGWGFVIFTLYSLETLNWRAPGGTTFIHYLYDEVLPKTYVEGEPPVFTPRSPSRSKLSFISQPQVLVRSVSFHNFFTVFHSLCGILVGYFGGLVADVLFRRREFRRRANEQRGGTTDAE